MKDVADILPSVAQGDPPTRGPKSEDVTLVPKDPVSVVTPPPDTRVISEHDATLISHSAFENAGEFATRDSGAGVQSTFASTPGGGPSGDGRLPVVDGYDLVRCIGQGGMGVVYEGVQQATGRRVAIKFLLEYGGSSESARHRFEREVEVVARLQHPGIVRIIDSGVRKGRYFYVMDFVSGTVLEESLPPGKVEIRKALASVIEVCEAVDYAHQRGVLHRDLKPSNILVDAEGRCHLLDFGVAKEVDASPTQRSITVVGEGQLIGTVAYMSPEQAGGMPENTSVRSDVYSLGVIAYQLVTGELPVKCAGALRDVLTAIAMQDPEAPSKLRPQVPHDLDAVLLKALEKSPDRRYATAGEFAGDLKRFLAGEPVTARRLSPLGRGWRWVKRHSAISATIATAAAVLIATSTFLVLRIIEERDRANENANQMKRNYELANNNFNLLRDVIEAADPDRSGEITVAQMLDSATRRLDNVPPESAPTEAAVREIIGSVYRKLARYEQAEKTLRRALAIREAQNPVEKAALAECLHNLAATLFWQGNVTEAKTYYQRSLALRREVFPPDHRDIATSLTHLAACEIETGDHAKARLFYQQALDIRRRLLGPEHEEVAQAMNNLAKSHLDAEEYADAERLFRDSLEMITKLRGPQYVGTAAVSQNLAKCFYDKGDFQSALDAYERALAIRRARFPNGHPVVASTLVGMARCNLALGNLDQALDLATQATEMFTRLKQEQLPEAGDAKGALGSVLLSQGKMEEARTALQAASQVLSQVKPPPRLQSAMVVLELAVVERALGTGGDDQIRAACQTLGRIRAPDSVLLRRCRDRLISLGIPPDQIEFRPPPPQNGVD